MEIIEIGQDIYFWKDIYFSTVNGTNLFTKKWEKDQKKVGNFFFIFKIFPIFSNFF